MLSYKLFILFELTGVTVTTCLKINRYFSGRLVRNSIENNMLYIPIIWIVS